MNFVKNFCILTVISSIINLVKKQSIRNPKRQNGGDPSPS